MSLNGLDSPEVQEAYQQAIAEAGGWFLLKYTSRDSVELLGSGKAGATEARIAVAKYEESSPLYGLIIYRRRKVLIKYIPDGTSRLLQARTAVHFQDVIEKYSPYETLIEIKTADALNDTSLAASFPLHTASPSAASNRLDEITEDAEDNGTGQAKPAVRTPTGYFGSQRNRVDRRTDQRMRAGSPQQSMDSSRESARPTSPLSSNMSAPMKTSVSQFLVRSDSGQPSITSLGTGSLSSMADFAGSEGSTKDTESLASTAEPSAAALNTKSVTSAPAVHSPQSSVVEDPAERLNTALSAETRQSSISTEMASERPSISTRPGTSDRANYDDDPYGLSQFDLKPKTKLGPRPVTTTERTKRATAAGISSVPATYKPTKKQEPFRPKSSVPIGMPLPGAPKILPTPPPIPDAPEYNPRPLSRGSIKSLPSHKSTAMTPDKIRLMKAVELRKKQMRKSNPQPDFVPPPESDTPAVPKLPEQTTKDDHVFQDDLQQAKAIVPESTATQRAEPVSNGAPLPSFIPNPATIPQPAIIAQEERLAAKKNDSGIEMGYDQAEKHEDKPTIDKLEGEVPAPVPVEAPEVSDVAPSQQLTREAAVIETKEPTTDNILLIPDLDTNRVKESEFTSGPDVNMPQAPTLEPSALPSQPSASEFRAAELERNKEVQDATPLRESNPVEEEMPGAFPTESPTLGPTVNGPVPMQLPTEDAAAVPTIVMADGTRPMTSNGQATELEKDSPILPETNAKASDESTSSAEDLDAPDMSPRRKNSDLARRRQGFVEPLNDPEPDLTTDDEYDDELDNATVEQATPITVSKSPISQFFQRRPSANSAVSNISAQEINIVNRSSTMPVDNTTAVAGRLSPDSTTDRPVTATSTDKNEPGLATQRKVSTGLSKRIQALAEMTTREPSPYGTTAARPLTPEKSASVFTQNDTKAGAKSPPKSRNASFKNVARHSARMSSYQSQATSNIPQQSNSTPTWSVQHDSTTGHDSVSVTARIIRPTASEQSTSPTTPVEPLNQPPSSINHNRNASSQASLPRLSPISTVNESARHRPEPLNLKQESPTATRMSVDNTRVPQSGGSAGKDRRSKKIASPTADDFPIPPTPTARTNSMAVNDDNVAPKESTRTSRFFKRMSNLGNKRKSVTQHSNNSTSPTSERQSMAMYNPAPVAREKDAPPAVIVGNLNTQFPDSLLWKRRLVEIDDAGYITFSVPQAMEHQRGVARKFQLSDFVAPHVPDLDRQELPNSIMLDFMDGTTLQVACEDAATHKQALNLLRNYWKSWSGA